MNRRGVFSAAAAVAVGALVAPSAARAAAVPPTPTLVADPAEADREMLRWILAHDPRAAVQSAAQQALATGGAAEFFASGFPAAASLAAQNRATQVSHANQTAATYPAQTHPWVNAAARRAAAGTDAELAEFAATGFAAAKAKDDAAMPYDDGAAQVIPADRDFVERLAATDPIDAVRERAAEVTTDAEVAEFLRHGLSSAGRIDLDEFRTLYVTDELAKWREARANTGRAVEADQAARAGTLDPFYAARAWQTLTTRSGRQPSAWDAREPFTVNRSDLWTRTGYFAEDALPHPLWESLLGDASELRSRWHTEIANTQGRYEWWSALMYYGQASTEYWLRG